MNKDLHDNPIENGKHVHEQLSDYIDGVLPDSARQAVQAHLAECAECQADYTGLLATVRLLQNTPAVQAPRAFTLTPEMAGQARRASWWERFLVHHNAPRLATGSLVAFLVLFVLVAGDLTNIANPVGTFTSPSEAKAPQDVAVATVQTSSAAIPNIAAAGPTETAAPAAPLGAASSASGAQDQTPSTAFAPAAPEASSTATSAPPALGASAQVQQDNGAEPPATETPELAFTTSSRVAPTAPPVGSNTGSIILQIALLVLGLGLGAAAFVAWRRT